MSELASPQSQTSVSNHITSDGEPTLGLPRAELRRTILSSLDISDQALAESEEAFWRGLAERHRVELEPDPVSLVQRVLERAGVTWDAEYVDEDTGSVTTAALEALQARLAAAEYTDEGEDEVATLSLDWQVTNLEAKKSDLPVEYLVSQVQGGKLVLNPDWQRAYVWNAEKQRRLIESILLGLPIPSFLFHRDSRSGRTYVIDGRQRLETLSKFKSAKPKRGKGERFKTFGPDRDGWGPGQPLHKAASKYYDELPAELQARIDEATLSVNTFVDLPPSALYQIFDRYNTGGVPLQAQEIRNAVYQESPVHQMIYRLAGEHATDSYLDGRERAAGTTLQKVMRRAVKRYGAYAFVGRFFAFRHMAAGSVATATVMFMEQMKSATDAQVEALRQQYLDAFEATHRWYEHPLVKSEEEPTWYAFFATLQMVGASVMHDEIVGGRTTEDKVRSAIRERWPAFAEPREGEQQNTSLFWNAQREWLQTLADALGLPAYAAGAVPAGTR